jgi:hypothetical protein
MVLQTQLQSDCSQLYRMNYDKDIEGESTLKPTQEATVKRLSKEKYRAKVKLLSRFTSI